MWLVKQKCSLNFNKLALHGIPEGAGEKGGIPKAIRKRKQNKAKTTIVDCLSSDRLDCDKVYNSQGWQFSASDPIVDQGGACFMLNQNNCFMPGASPPPSQYCHMPMYGNAGPSVTHSMMPTLMTCN